MNYNALPVEIDHGHFGMLKCVEESLLATLKCLKPKIGKDIARYIGKYIWLNKREWDHWPKAKEPKFYL